MSHIFIIGATGGVGHRLCPMLIKAGHKVTGLHRKPEQAAYLSGLGVTPVIGDMMKMTAEDIARAASGADVIVFSAGAAGSGRERTHEIDGNGPAKAIAAAKAIGAKRFYIVSAFPEAGRNAQPDAGFEFYMSEKKRADVEVVRSGLDWLILRPGTLLHEDGDGQVALDLALPYGSVARGNVARVLAGLIDNPAIHHRILELTDGDTPATDAINTIAKLP